MKFQKWTKYLVRQEILNFFRWLKSCSTNNFVRLKICSISYLLYNEENYSTFLSLLSTTTFPGSQFLFFSKSSKKSSVFQNWSQQPFSIFPNFEYKDYLIKYFLSLLANFYGKWVSHFVLIFLLLTLVINGPV